MLGRIDKKGYSLVEMIGVLAVIAILSGMLAPKVFQIIADSKSTRVSAEARVYESAVVNWYKDMGTLSLVNGSCVPVSTTQTVVLSDYLTGKTTTGCIRYKGPYVDSMSITPAIGTGVTIYSRLFTGSLAANNSVFDLNGDGVGDTSGKTTVYSEYQGVTQDEFEGVEVILDAGIPSTSTTKELGGRVKYDAALKTMFIYLAHR